MAFGADSSKGWDPGRRPRNDEAKDRAMARGKGGGGSSSTEKENPKQNGVWDEVFWGWNTLTIIKFFKIMGFEGCILPPKSPNPGQSHGERLGQGESPTKNTLNKTWIGAEPRRGLGDGAS